MSTAEQIIREIQKLPEPLAREVLDFIGYIELKHGLKDRLTEELKQAQAIRYAAHLGQSRRRGLE